MICGDCVGILRDNGEDLGVMVRWPVTPVWVVDVLLDCWLVVVKKGFVGLSKFWVLHCRWFVCIVLFSPVLFLWFPGLYQPISKVVSGIVVVVCCCLLGCCLYYCWDWACFWVIWVWLLMVIFRGVSGLYWCKWHFSFHVEHPLGYFNVGWPPAWQGLAESFCRGWQGSVHSACRAGQPSLPFGQSVVIIP